MLLQTNHNTEQLSQCILAPPYLPLLAAGSELLQPVGFQLLVLLWHLQEQRVRELQPLSQLQGQGTAGIGTRARSTGIWAHGLRKKAVFCNILK